MEKQINILVISEQILGKIRSKSPRHTFTYPQLSEFFNRHPNEGRKHKDYFIQELNKVISRIEWTGKFRWDYNESMKKYGVYEKVGDYWVWSCVNTIETHNGVIAIFINSINTLIEKNKLDGQVITFETLNIKPYHVISRLLSFIEQYSNYIFDLDKTNKKIYIDCRIDTDKTWWNSKMKEMVVIREIKSETEFTKNRGDGNDYYNNVDFVIGGKTCQHTISTVSIDVNGDIYFSKSNISKRNGSNGIVDLIYIKDKGTLDTYVFNGEKILSNLTDLTVDSGLIKVNDDFLIDVLSDNQDDIYLNTLNDVFSICQRNNIFFDMLEGLGDVPFVEYTDNHVILSFNNQHIEELGEDLFKLKDELLDRFN